MRLSEVHTLLTLKKKKNHFFFHFLIGCSILLEENVTAFENTDKDIWWSHFKSINCMERWHMRSLTERDKKETERRVFSSFDIILVSSNFSHWCESKTMVLLKLLDCQTLYWYNILSPWISEPVASFNLMLQKCRTYMTHLSKFLEIRLDAEKNHRCFYQSTVLNMTTDPKLT